MIKWTTNAIDDTVFIGMQANCKYRNKQKY